LLQFSATNNFWENGFIFNGNVQEINGKEASNYDILIWEIKFEAKMYSINADNHSV